MLIKQDFIVRGLGGEQQGEGTGLLYHVALSVRLASNGVSFQVVSGQLLSNSRAWLSCSLLHCSHMIRRCAWLHAPHPYVTKNYIHGPRLSFYFFEKFSELYETVSWASFLILSQKTFKAQLTLGKPFVFSRHNLSFRLSLNKNRKKTQQLCFFPNLQTSPIASKACRYCKHSGLRKQKYVLAEFAFFLCAFEMYLFYPVFLLAVTLFIASVVEI